MTEDEKNEKKRENKSFNTWFSIIIGGIIFHFIGAAIRSKLLMTISMPLGFVICGIYHFNHEIYSKGWLSKTWRIIYGVGFIGFGLFILYKQYKFWW